MGHHKPHLPTKVCLSCGRPYAWRKRWRDCWNEVRYCSERCRRSGGRGTVVKSAAASFNHEGEEA